MTNHLRMMKTALRQHQPQIQLPDTVRDILHYLERRARHLSDQPLSVLRVGIRTEDHIDWHVVCLRCGFCSLANSDRPTSPICQACSDLFDGQRNLAALARAIAIRSRLADVLVEG